MSIYLKHGVSYVSDNTATTLNCTITVLDPDNSMNMPIYEGERDNAHKNLIPGVYDGTTDLDSFGTTIPIVVLITPNSTYVLDGDLIPITGMNPNIPHLTR
jgi:hypothetical protein